MSRVLAGAGDRDVAYEEFRTYTLMLLSAAPVLIDAQMSRNFLEQAQQLAGEMAGALGTAARVDQTRAQVAQIGGTACGLLSALPRSVPSR